MSPSQSESGTRSAKASTASGRLTNSASASAQRSTRTWRSGCALAHMRDTAAGRPETTGVISSICALCASSTSPMACAPSSRESQMRSRNPTTRTRKCVPLRKIVWLTSVRMSITPPRDMRARHILAA